MRVYHAALHSPAMLHDNLCVSRYERWPKSFKFECASSAYVWRVHNYIKAQYSLCHRLGTIGFLNSSQTRVKFSHYTFFNRTRPFPSFEVLCRPKILTRIPPSIFLPFIPVPIIKINPTSRKTCCGRSVSEARELGFTRQSAYICLCQFWNQEPAECWYIHSFIFIIPKKLGLKTTASRHF